MSYKRMLCPGVCALPDVSRAVVLLPGTRWRDRERSPLADAGTRRAESYQAGDALAGRRRALEMFHMEHNRAFSTGTNV